MPRLLLLCMCVLATGVPFGCQSERDSVAPNKPKAHEPPGPQGVFWIDRWGQGRLDAYAEFVDESCFPKLRPHIGVPIRIIAPEFSGFGDDKGPDYLTGLGTVERLVAPVSIRLRWLSDTGKLLDTPVSRMRSTQDASFEVQLTNQSSDKLILDSHWLTLAKRLRHPPGWGFGSADRHWGHGTGQRRRGVLRILGHHWSSLPHDTTVTCEPSGKFAEFPSSTEQKVVASGATHTWKVTLTDLLPNEYELYYVFRDHATPVAGVYSNRLALDVLTDEAPQNDIIELHVQQRETVALKSGQPVPLEIRFQNRTAKEWWFQMDHSTKDDLDLSDMLFCYGSDGQLLPITTKVPGPPVIPNGVNAGAGVVDGRDDHEGRVEIQIPANATFTLPVDAPAGTVVARAVFLRYGWHWSEHWIAPAIRKSVDGEKDR